MSDFLVDASLPRATGDLIRQRGHRAKLEHLPILDSSPIMQLYVLAMETAYQPAAQARTGKIPC